ncbi:MAG: type pilus assembly protein PilC [Frankiales bacterium]|nr:type pilus assembly protein PilC [Frankiales bacterium]
MSVTDQLDPVAPVLLPARRKDKKKSFLQFEITAKKVSRTSLMHFSRQLAVFIKAGIPILDALDAIHAETGDKLLRTIAEDVIEELRSGSTFADAMARHNNALPPYYLGILRSAELTGKLDTVLVQLAEYIERDLEARRKVTAALAYPAVILATSVVVVIVLVAFVLPRFVTFFDSLGAELPLPTRILLSGTGFVTDAKILIGLGTLSWLVIIGLALRTERGKSGRDRLLLRLPLIGDLAQHIVLERFCRILSAMMGAGVPLPQALAVTTEATTNRVYRQGLVEARAGMMRGEGLAVPLIETGLFPPSARQMFRVGERTGTLDQQLETAAAYFERELDYKIKRFTTLFEPAVLLIVGAMVGFVAIALVSAMYGIFGQTRTP